MTDPAPTSSDTLLADLAPLRVTGSSRAARWLRAGIAFVVVGAATFAVIQLVSGDSLTEAELEATVAGFGAWGPVVFLLLFATLGSLVIPTTVLTVIGATLWGPLLGFGYSMLGAFCAALLGFSAARTLGRRQVLAWLERRGGRLAALDRRLATHGFTTAVFMRLLYLPNGLINVVCGVSAIPARVYALATLLGTLPMVFAIAFVTGGAREALLSGDASALLEPEVLLSALLFAACITVPLVKIARQRRRARSDSTRT